MRNAECTRKPPEKSKRHSNALVSVYRVFVDHHHTQESPRRMSFRCSACTPTASSTFSHGGALTVEPTDRTDAPHTAVSTGIVHGSSSLWPVTAPPPHRASLSFPHSFRVPLQCCRRGVHTGPHTGHMLLADTIHLAACGPAAGCRDDFWRFHH